MRLGIGTALYVPSVTVLCQIIDWLVMSKQLPWCKIDLHCIFWFTWSTYLILCHYHGVLVLSIPYIISTKPDKRFWTFLTQVILATIKTYTRVIFCNTILRVNVINVMLCLFLKHTAHLSHLSEGKYRIKAKISKTHTTFVKCITLVCTIYIYSLTQQLTWNKVYLLYVLSCCKVIRWCTVPLDKDTLISFVYKIRGWGYHSIAHTLVKFHYCAYCHLIVFWIKSFSKTHWHAAQFMINGPVIMAAQSRRDQIWRLEVWDKL